MRPDGCWVVQPWDDQFDTIVPCDGHWRRDHQQAPRLPTSEKHMLAVVPDTCVVRSETDMVPLHKGGAGNVPAGAWTLMVPVLAASAPLTDVVNSMV